MSKIPEETRKHLIRGALCYFQSYLYNEYCNLLMAIKDCSDGDNENFLIIEAQQNIETRHLISEILDHDNI